MPSPKAGLAGVHLGADHGHMTPTVTIRPLEAGDADAVQRYASDELVARTTTIPSPYPEDGGIQFVQACITARAEGRSYSFAILAGGDLVGVVGINAVDRNKGVAQCDYGIASTHWNRGITAAAVSKALQFAFDDLGLETVYSACLERNPGSGRVLEKNGFTETERFVFSSSKFQGEPARRFRLKKSEWLSSQAGPS